MHNKDELYSLYSRKLLQATEGAALACQEWVGRGKEKDADKAAVEAMRAAFNSVDMEGRIIIGEGERDKAPMLYVGEKVGLGGVALDIAVDPLEGTTICATGGMNSVSVLAAGPKDSMLCAPDVYMEKLAVQSELSPGVINLDFSVKQNMDNICAEVGCALQDVVVTILNRPRHEKMIGECRRLGLRVNLISDGDIFATIDPYLKNDGFFHVYMGIGGAPEGVLAAAALKTLGGSMLGRLILDDDVKRKSALKCGIEPRDNKQYGINDMVGNDVIFIATGVTSGSVLDGVEIYEKWANINSVILSSCSKRIEYVNAAVPLL